MKKPSIRTTLLAGIAFMAIAASPAAYATEEHHTDDTASNAETSMPGDTSSAGINGNMPSMEGMMSPDMMQMMESMMTPEMMEMMHQMMRQGGMQGMGTNGPGMHGRGMMMGQNMMPMHGSAGRMPGGRQSAMPAMMQTLGAIYGMAGKDQKEMTPETVRSWLETRLEWHGNPRLKIGEIGSETDGVITAEIVTIDGSLVQKLAFNRYPGLVRQVND